MCRLLAFVGKENFRKEDVDTIWNRFMDMAMDKTKNHELNVNKQGQFTHNHGWGVVWLQNGKLESYHSITQIWDDKIPNEIFEQLLDANFIMLHVRKASPGLPVKIESLHPFIRQSQKYGNIPLIHNGTISNYEAIKIDPSLKQLTQSDTERFLLSIITELDSSNDVSDIVSQIKKVVNELPTYSGLNFMTLIDGNIIVSRNYTKNENYLSLYQGTNGDNTIFCSETIPLSGYDWRLLANHEYIEIPVGQSITPKVPN